MHLQKEDDLRILFLMRSTKNQKNLYPLTLNLLSPELKGIPEECILGVSQFSVEFDSYFNRACFVLMV